MACSTIPLMAVEGGSGAEARCAPFKTCTSPSTNTPAARRRDCCPGCCRSPGSNTCAGVEPAVEILGGDGGWIRLRHSKLGAVIISAYARDVFRTGENKNSATFRGARRAYSSQKLRTQIGSLGSPENGCFNPLAYSSSVTVDAAICTHGSREGLPDTEKD
jgi:hypothetical protein